MDKLCSILVYRVFNDRNSTTRNLEEVIDVDADTIKVASPFPGWRWSADAPVVDYYDGEHLELSYLGKHFEVRAGDDPVEVIDVQLPDNVYVVESKSFCIHLAEIHKPADYPSWNEMRSHGSLSALVLRALPIISANSGDGAAVAARQFLRIFTAPDNLFLLNGEAVRFIEEYAAAGNKYALYALGRYHQCTQIDKDSHRLAQKYAIEAYGKGLAEAGVQLSQMYRNGDMDVVDRAKSDCLLGEALNKKCDYAAEVYLNRLIFGLFGVEANPQKALQLVDGIIAGDIALCGEGNENPMWYYCRGCAKQQISGLSSAKEDYRKAADMGVIYAWADVAISNSYNDDFELIDKAAFLRSVKYGAKKRDCLCRCLYALAKVEDYENMSEYKQAIERKNLIVNLEAASSLGPFPAAEELGDIYYYGKYGVEEDDQKAWEWYSKGALMHSVTCYEKMFDMVHDHYIDADPDFVDMVVISGARLGSEKLLNETVMRYTYGRLTEFAAEIEQYYVPVFDAEEGHSDAEDAGPDDDGRFDAYV